MLYSAGMRMLLGVLAAGASFAQDDFGAAVRAHFK